MGFWIQDSHTDTLHNVKKVFFSKPTKNVLLCYTNFLTSFAREKNNPSPPPVKKKITYGYLEVTLVYDVANTLLSELEKNMDLRIRLFFVNLVNIWKEITYIHLSASLKLPKVQTLNQRPNRNQSLHDLFTKPCICSVCLEKNWNTVSDFDLIFF